MRLCHQVVWFLLLWVACCLRALELWRLEDYGGPKGTHFQKAALSTCFSVQAFGHHLQDYRPPSNIPAGASVRTPPRCAVSDVPTFECSMNDSAIESGRSCGGYCPWPLATLAASPCFPLVMVNALLVCSWADANNVVWLRFGPLGCSRRTVADVALQSGLFRALGRHTQ
jgi:hypothetical protein